MSEDEHKKEYDIDLQTFNRDAFVEAMGDDAHALVIMQMVLLN